MTKTVSFKNLNQQEQSWFENAIADSVEFYLTTGYMNFIIANGVVVTSKFWKVGLSLELQQLDAQTKRILESAFPTGKLYRSIVCLYIMTGRSSLPFPKSTIRKLMNATAISGLLQCRLMNKNSK